MTKWLSRGRYVLCLALLQPYTDLSISIPLWLTRPWGLYDGSSLNLLSLFWFICCLTSHSTIFQLYLWRHIMCRRTLTCLSKHRHGTNLFIRVFRETAPFQSPFTASMGIQRIYSHLKTPRVPKGKTSSEETRPWSSSPLIVIWDSFKMFFGPCVQNNSSLYVTLDFTRNRLIQLWCTRRKREFKNGKHKETDALSLWHQQ